MNICILDFESTGLNYLKDEIIETSLKIYNKNIWYNSISKPDYRGKLGAYVTPLITEITNISNKMIHKGISQEQLVEIMNVPLSTISYWLKGLIKERIIQKTKINRKNQYYIKPELIEIINERLKK